MARGSGAAGEGQRRTRVASRLPPTRAFAHAHLPPPSSPPPQICHEFERFSVYMPGVRVANFFGGLPIKQHKELLKNNTPHIIVGTPGRLKQVSVCVVAWGPHREREERRQGDSTHPPPPAQPPLPSSQLAAEGDLKLGSVRHFVVDECDKVLDNVEMRADVQDVFKRTPHDKQVLMFSATLAGDVRPICKKFMTDVRTVKETMEGWGGARHTHTREHWRGGACAAA